jgi:hypothetical protein
MAMGITRTDILIRIPITVITDRIVTMAITGRIIGRAAAVTTITGRTGTGNIESITGTKPLISQCRRNNLKKLARIFEPAFCFTRNAAPLQGYRHKQARRRPTALNYFGDSAAFGVALPFDRSS